MQLGDKARDRITGVTGIVVAEHRYLNGCLRVSIQPQELKDGKPVEGTTFDVEQCELVEAGAMKVLQPSGGPETTPRRQIVPSR